MNSRISHREACPSHEKTPIWSRSAALSLICIPVLSLFIYGSVLAQGPPDVRFRVWFSMTDSSSHPRTSTVKFGLHPTATYCVDTLLTGFTDHWFEDDSGSVDELKQYPGCPPTLEARLFNARSGCFEFSGEGRPVNIHQFHDTTETDTFRIKWCASDSPTDPLILRWPSVLRYYCDSMKLTDP